MLIFVQDGIAIMVTIRPTRFSLGTLVIRKKSYNSYTKALLALKY